MNNKFTGVTPDKKMKTIGIDRYVPQEDNAYAARVTGQLTYGEVFDQLKAHLEYVEMLPDEYLMFSPEINPDDHILKDWRSFRLNTAFGGSEGIYIDISLDTDHGKTDFATGKTLNESTEDFVKMCRIAAECDLMLNGNGEVRELPCNVRELLKERSIVHGNICDLTFYVTSYDTENRGREPEKIALNLTLDEAKEEFEIRANRYPGNVITLLGVDYRTGRRDLNLHGVGADDLIQCKDGKLQLLDWETDPVLKEEVIFPDTSFMDAADALKQFVGELSDSEGKLVRTGLVMDGDDVHEEAASVKGEIERHNDLEDEGLTEDDQLQL